MAAALLTTVTSVASRTTATSVSSLTTAASVATLPTSNSVAALAMEHTCSGNVTPLWTVTGSLALVILALVVRTGSLAGLFGKLAALVRSPRAPSAASAPAEVPEALLLQEAYRAAGGPCVALRGRQLLVTRLDVIHRVCHDHGLFPNRGLPKNEKANPLSLHLFSLEDKRWSVVRAVMSPAFTQAKLKAVFPLHATGTLQNIVDSTIGDQLYADVEIKDVMERFVTDDVGRTLFGVECRALERPGNPMHAHCAEAFSNSAWWRRLRQRLMDVCPRVAVHIPYRNSTARFFQKIVRDLRTAREAKKSSHSTLLDSMIQAENEMEKDAAQGRMLRSVHAPQMFATFRAGFEATAPTLAFALLELAHNQDVQRRLQEELDLHAQQDGGDAGEAVFTAQSLADMTYLDCVVKETLRKYPPNATLIRHASSRCTLPGTEGDEAVTVEEGTRLVVPVYAVHHDPAYFPEPEAFRPERFLPAAESRGDSTVAPANLKAYLPFGLGRRHCVARRFALQEVKMGLAAVLHRFHVSPCAATPSLPPPFLAGRSIVLALKDHCTLRVSPRRPRGPEPSSPVSTVLNKSLP
ncbi:cytochrome P450 6a22-like isoform X2 [Thrips palmi]|uniref:Cytochrome P450 6a22-like isoform X2 n=1 Tax=Thrips palmi TaxID=161013 RepID=A0A6P8YCE2_THRPL|nr:cytochrome P450 6a22-like isoform X2 [Thrips palmi]